jgi:tRNA-2-methylthio-N6-dimethylallyladenosine synthase
MAKKKLHIHTIGCQMNVYDSETIASLMAPLGYERIADPAQADLVIVNTCTIREKAEQKVFSLLGRLDRLKRRRSHMIIGVGGCVAQQQGERMFQRASFIDIVFGTQAIARLPELVREAECGTRRLVDVGLKAPFDSLARRPAPSGESGVCRFVTIMQGCDNYCTYCVVPYVRGREISRRPEQIVEEVRSLVAVGVREVTLLGQNVNSYGKKEGFCSFAKLLEQVHSVEGLRRIRFTTSHPKDLSTELCRAFRDLPRLCRHIHLPVQSGSNRILRRMNRRYTRQDYLEKIAELRFFCPDIAVSSDFIVGFPGEGHSDFADTLSLVETVSYDSLFAFMYSDRPEAPASRYPEKVPQTEKEARLQRLLALQERISRKKNRALVGTIQEVLVEGASKKNTIFGRDSIPHAENAVQWSGRTPHNKIVNFEQQTHSALTGRRVRVRVEKAFAHSLWGTPVETSVAAVAAKGETSHAA